MSVGSPLSQRGARGDFGELDMKNEHRTSNIEWEKTKKQKSIHT